MAAIALVMATVAMVATGAATVAILSISISDLVGLYFLIMGVGVATIIAVMVAVGIAAMGITGTKVIVVMVVDIIVDTVGVIVKMLFARTSPSIWFAFIILVLAFLLVMSGLLTAISDIMSVDEKPHQYQPLPIIHEA